MWDYGDFGRVGEYWDLSTTNAFSCASDCRWVHQMLTDLKPNTKIKPDPELLVGQSGEEIKIAECTWVGEGRAAPGYMLAAWRFILGKGAK